MEAIEKLQKDLKQEEIKKIKIIGFLLITLFLPFNILRFIIIVIIIYFLVQIFIARRDFKYAVKKIVSRDIFTKIFDSHTFNPKGKYDTETLKSLDIISVGASTTSNDLLEGSLHGINFKRADVRSYTVVTTGKTTVVVNHFTGQVYEFDFFKESKSYLRIRTKGFLGSGKGRKVEASQPIKLDDHDFNDRYYCYTNNDQEAFYLFTPHFMQRIKELDDQIDGEFTLIINHSKLYISVFNNTDSFEPNTSKDYFENVQKDIGIITLIIDKLDLQNSLFK